LDLSKSELDQLALGSSIKLKDLLQNKSFSELDSGLLRLDALTTAEQLPDAIRNQTAMQICFMVDGKKICINFREPQFSDSLDLNVEILDNF
jgi:hypothetical protein